MFRFSTVTQKTMGYLMALVAIGTLLMLALFVNVSEIQAQGPIKTPTPQTTLDPKKSGSVKAPKSFAIINGSPLSITVSSSGNYQVYYNGETQGSFYDEDVPDPDQGIVIYTDNSYGASSHTTKAHNLNFTEVSQSAVTGSGTAAAPWQVVNRLSIPSQASITQTISYVNGNNYNSLDTQICNISGSTLSLKYYHVGDLYLGGSDEGYGYYNGTLNMIGGMNATQDKYIVFQALTPNYKYFEDYYRLPFYAARDGNDYPNTYHPTTYEDNGAGLNWGTSLNNGACVTYSSRTLFSSSAPKTASTTTLTGPSGNFTGAQSFTFNATVAGAAAAPAKTSAAKAPSQTGTVTFYDNNVVIPTCASVTLVSGVASCTVTLQPGTHVIRAHYNGDATYAASDSTTTLTLAVAQTVTVNSSPKEVPEGDTLLLLGGGMSGVGVWLRYQWSKRKGIRK